jgi:hypothetical protein
MRGQHQTTNQREYFWNGSSDPKAQRAKKREIAKSYEHPFDMAVQRVAELQKLFAHLYGDGSSEAYVLPDDDAGRDNAFIMICHLALCPVAPRWRRLNWLKAHAPWMPAREQMKLLNRRVLTFKADTLALRLGVTFAMRQRLGFRTIGAYDVTRTMRDIWVAREQREKDRTSSEARRRKAGAKSRAQYLAESDSRRKPWLAFGWSRRTWHRHGKPEPGESPNVTSPSEVLVPEEPSPDGVVSRVDAGSGRRAASSERLRRGERPCPPHLVR